MPKRFDGFFALSTSLSTHFRRTPKSLARLLQLLFILSSGSGFVMIALLLLPAARTPTAQAAPLIQPLIAAITNPVLISHTAATTHQMSVFADGRITNWYQNDDGQNQVDQDGADITDTTIAVMFDQHGATAKGVDIGVRGDFYTITHITLNTPSNISNYSEDSQVVYASRVLSYQITQRTLAIRTNNCVVMKFAISNTSSSTFLTGGKLLYRVDIDAGLVYTSDIGVYDSDKHLVYHKDYNTETGYAMGISLLKGDFGGYGIVTDNFSQYPDSLNETAIKNELITPTNAIVGNPLNNNLVSWLVANIPDLAPRQATTLAFGLCARTAPDPDAQEEAKDAMLDDFTQLNLGHFPALDLNISKFPLTATNIGTTVTYVFEVKHASRSDNSSVSNLIISSTLPGPLFRTLGSDQNNNGKLDEGEIWTYTANYTFHPSDPNPFVTIGMVYGQDQDGDNVTAINSHTTALTGYRPRLTLNKTGPATSRLNETVVYTFSVNHTAASDDSPVSNLTVSDNIASPPIRSSGDSNSNNKLDSNETWVYTASYIPQLSDTDPLTNTAVVHGQAADGVSVPTVTDTHSLDIEYRPVLKIIVNGPSTANVNNVASYIFRVSHDLARSDGSPVRINSFSNNLTDDTITPDIKDENDNDKLDENETWTYYVNHSVKPSDPNPLVNIGTIVGQDLDGDPIVISSSYTTTLRNFNPHLILDKVGPTTANAGETVTYDFYVSHSLPGSGSPHSDGSPVHTVSVSDTVAGAANFAGGDNNQNDELDQGEIWHYTASYTLPLTGTDPLTNIAVVNAYDSENDLTTATDNHSLNVEYNPVLELKKEGPAIAEIGETITYTFTISHAATSDGSPINNILLTDTLTLTPTPVYTGDGDSILEAGEIWVYQANYYISSINSRTLVNTVTVQGRDRDDDSVMATASHAVEFHDFKPHLTLVKTGPITAELGQTVVYTFAVSHAATSDGSSVHTISVTDDVAGSVNYVSGDKGVIGKLEVDETWLYTVSYPIHLSRPDPLISKGIVRATDLENDMITSTNVYTLDIEYNPVLDLQKSGPITTTAGETIIYTFTLEHGAGSDGSPISDISLDDSLKITPTRISSDGNNNLDIGEIWVYTASYTIPSSFSGPLVSTVTIQGKDRDGDIVTAVSTHEIGINLPPQGTTIYLPMILKDPPSLPSCTVDHSYYIDRFDGATSSKWINGSHLEADYSYIPLNTPSEYQIYAKAPNEIPTSRSASPYGSFISYTVKVDVKWASEPLGDEYGIIFGIRGKDNQRVTAAASLYRFVINTRNNREFSLRRYNGSEWHPVVDWTINNSPINEGTTFNTLEVRCYGLSAAIYTNGNLLWQDDLPVTCSGEVGVTSSIARLDTKTYSRFDNFQICGQPDTEASSSEVITVIPNDSSSQPND